MTNTIDLPTARQSRPDAAAPIGSVGDFVAAIGENVSSVTIK